MLRSILKKKLDGFSSIWEKYHYLKTFKILDKYFL